MSSAPASPCPIEELLADDPLAPGSDAETNTLDQGELPSAGSTSPWIMDHQRETIAGNEDDQEAILVDEETNKCYTCHQEFLASSHSPELVVDVQQSESVKLTIKVCLGCYKRLDYDNYKSREYSVKKFSGCPILSESKIIVNDSSISHKCFRCYEPLPCRSLHPVSLQDGIFNPSRPVVLQELGYEFAVYLCDQCAQWKANCGRMREVTTLKFPAYDQATRSLYLPPITSAQMQPHSSQAAAKSINYPVSMLVNKAKSLLERFKNEASLTSPPSAITGCMMYIHTTKSNSSPSTHWSCDGFAFQKTSTRVVRIQNSDHVIRETKWVTAGPGDPETKFSRRTITSSQIKDITLVHYLGDVEKGIRVSREVELEDEDTNTHEPRSKLHNNDDLDQINPGPVISSVQSTSSSDIFMPTISSVMGSVGGLPVVGSTTPTPSLITQPLTSRSKIAVQYPTNLSSRLGPVVTQSVFQPPLHQIKKVCSPVQHQVVFPTQPLPVFPTQPLPVSAVQAPPKTSFPTLAPKVVVSGNQIILPPSFLASGARLLQIPASDGTKRLVLINSKQLSTSTSSTNTATKTTSVVSSIPSTSKSLFLKSQNKKLSIPSLLNSEGSITTKNYVVKDEPETAVDPLEIDARHNQPHPSPNQAPVQQTKMNHLERSAAVKANICAEVAEECIFNKNFSDVLIYGAKSSEQKNPLRTHSLLLAAISPNLKLLLEKGERNGDGVFELVIPGVALQEIEAFMEEVIGTLLMPPKDDNSVTFSMSENLWSLFAGVRPEEAELGKKWIQNKLVVPNSFSARIKSVDRLTGWANNSVCDEQTGQMVIQLGTKRRMGDSGTAHSPPKTIKLSDWSKQVGSVIQDNIQERDQFSPIIFTDENKAQSDDDYEVVIDSVEDHSMQRKIPPHDSHPMMHTGYNIHTDMLPIRDVSVDIENLHYRDLKTVVHLARWKKIKKVDKLYPPCGSPQRNDLDLLTYEDDPLDNDYVPRVKMKTSSNIKGSMVRKKTPEKWIVNQ
eukprot:GFUD01020190.1.p1 GENE.GFUD01020190.1~~GFUD01020190.1.p1  ORF type:complete len:1011 (+),score=273.60 GFUD01020190.1:120-3152(+)